MLLVSCCLAFLLGESLGAPSANQFFDNVFHVALPKILKNQKLDPAPLGDFSYTYYDKTFVGKVKGQADYSNGKLIGLSKVSRYGDCYGPLNVTGRVSINCTLSLTQLKTDYNGKVKYGVLPKVSITAKAAIDPVYIPVEIVKFPYERTAKVKSFGFRGIYSMKTDFSGLGPLNKHMKVLEANYKERVPSEVGYVLTHRFSYAVNQAVAQVPMPIR